MYDIVSDILARVRRFLDAGAPTWLDDVERQIRADWGGDRPYIARARSDEARRQMSTRDARIGRDYRHGESVTLIARRYGLSRGRVYKILARGQEVSPACLTGDAPDGGDSRA